MKVKMVIIGPSTPWSSRSPELKKKGHTLINQRYETRSNAFHCNSKTPSDTHLFYEMYEEPGKLRPHKLFYKILGSTELPDLTEYQDCVTEVDFSGRVCSIKQAFQVIRLLPKCHTMTFVIGESEQKECFVLDEDDKNEVIDLCPIPHVRVMNVLFPSRAKDTKFLSFAQKQTRRLFREAGYNFPNIEELEISLPGVESYQIVKAALTKWKRLRYNYDIQIIQDTVSLATLSPREVEPVEVPPETDPKQKSLELEKNLEPIHSGQKTSSSAEDGHIHPCLKRPHDPTKNGLPYHRSICDDSDPYYDDGSKRPRLSAEEGIEMKSSDKTDKMPINEAALASWEKDDDYDENYNYTKENYEKYSYPYYDDIKPDLKPDVKMEKRDLKTRRKVLEIEWSPEKMNEFQQLFTRRPTPLEHPEPDSGAEEVEYWVIPIHRGIPNIAKIDKRRIRFIED